MNMKNILILLVFFSVPKLLGQTVNFDVVEFEGKGGKNVFVGKQTTLLIKNYTPNNKDSIIFQQKEEYFLTIDELEFTIPPKIDVIKQGMIVTITVPTKYGSIILGIDKNLKIRGSKNVLLGIAKINVVGEKPLFQSETTTSFRQGDDYKEVILKGKNLTSVSGIAPIENFKLMYTDEFDFISDEEIRIIIKPVNAKVSTKQQFKINYKLVDWKNKTESYEEDTMEFEIVVGSVIKGILKDMYPKKVFLEDIKTNNNKLSITIVLTENVGKDRIGNLKIYFEELNKKYAELPAIDFKSVDASEGTVSMDMGDVKPGIKKLEILKGPNQNDIEGTFEIKILGEPKITAIFGSAGNSLNYNLFEHSDKLIVTGDNFDDAVRVVLWENEALNYIGLTENEKRSTGTKKEITLDLINKSAVKFGEYSVGLVREKDGKETTYSSFVGKIKIIQPQKPKRLDKFISIKVDSVSAPLSRTDLFTSEVDSEISIYLDGNKIESRFGPQAVNMKATLLDQYGDIIAIREYQNPRLGTSYCLVGTKERVFSQSRDYDAWNLSKAFDGQILPWAKIIIEANHSSLYYSGIDKIDPDYESGEILIKGNWYDNFSSTITAPPALFAYRSGEIQVLPLNFGFGIRYDLFRLSSGKRSGFTIGGYFFGLNNLHTAGSDTLKTVVSPGDSTTFPQITTELVNSSDGFIKKGDLSFIILTEIPLFNMEQKLYLPLQVGWGTTFGIQNRKSIGFLVFGFGINFHF